jgi:dTDP-4-amino-4,6-dideoxygalactose transaminase
LVPLVDLKAQYLSIKPEIDAAISEVISSGNFIRGNAVAEFERVFAEYLGVNYCIGVANGTDALEIILKSLEIGIGDEVIVPALSWIATAECVSNCGAEPVFVDIDRDTYTIDPAEIESKITKKTKAIIPVHLYGCPANMKRIAEIAERNGVKIVEDCAQAHGAEIQQKKVGAYGIASSFSFFPTKNLGAFGDGGAIVTNDSVIYEKAVRISNHGQLRTKHEHSLIGRNSRLDTIQAAVLCVKLKYLDSWNDRRIDAANQYISRLSVTEEIVLPEVPPGFKHVFHLFVIRVMHRNLLIDIFNKSKVAYAIHYPVPLPFTKAYSYKNHRPDDFKTTKLISEEIISLPLYPELSDSQINEICNIITCQYLV